MIYILFIASIYSVVCCCKYFFIYLTYNCNLCNLASNSSIDNAMELNSKMNNMKKCERWADERWAELICCNFGILNFRVEFWSELPDYHFFPIQCSTQLMQPQAPNYRTQNTKINKNSFKVWKNILRFFSSS